MAEEIQQTTIPLPVEPPAPRDPEEPARIEMTDPRLYINRELSQMRFNERVLDEALDASLPLFERLKFFGIAASNFDEFFMVRVAGIKQQILQQNAVETGPDGMSPADLLLTITDRMHQHAVHVDQVWNEVLPALSQAGLHLVRSDNFTPEQRTAARNYFTSQVFPALTPLAVDPGHPFPLLRNKSINLVVRLTKKTRGRNKQPIESLLAVVQVPSVLDRIVRLPSQAGHAFCLLEELCAAHVGDLFPGYIVKQLAAFRVIRNWDLLVDEEESEDLMSSIEQELRRRERGAAVRLEIAAGSPVELGEVLQRALKLGPSDIYRSASPFQPGDLMALQAFDPRPELRAEPLVPMTPQFLADADSIIEQVQKRDILLHHPYESFDPVVRFVEEAAEDPNVLAIKHTLYRTSGDSPFVRALSRAAFNGKQVTALVEIKARFDEANNIAWAKRLEANGVHVVYGLIGLKTHCKVALVVRKEGNGIRRYVHLGTGNYNPNTARGYTDTSLLTCREAIADDASALFNVLTGWAEPPMMKKLTVAPFGLQDRIVQLIEREAQRAQRGEPARIIAKMNSLVDPVVMRALFAASNAGVEIDLIVRGICCLRPGVPGASERIRVTSIVDRFLEHSRIFAFGVGDRVEVFMSSADWMPRNFLRRIEVMVPVEDIVLRNRLLEEVLGGALRDNTKARRLQPDGTYQLVQPGVVKIRSQMVLLDAAKTAAEAPAEAPVLRTVASPTLQ